MCDVRPIRFRLDGLGRLEELRDARKPHVVQEMRERGESELPFADVLVPVDAAAQRFLRVVEVKGTDVLDSDVLER